MVTKKPTITNVNVDGAIALGELAHNWNYIGFDEINYTYVPEGQALLARFQELQEKPYYVRAHHLFCTGNGHASYKWGSTNAYLEDDHGHPVYSWNFVDLVFDALLQHGCKPFVELGFMPQDLADPGLYDASKETFRMQNYQSHGWNCPPKDYQKWHDLVFHLVRHCMDRYGVDEVKTWYFELWNEPDLSYYWRGSVDEFNKLYDFTVAAVKTACPDARVGGPGTTNPRRDAKSGDYLEKFLEHCAGGVNAVTGQIGTTVDFVTFHVKGGGYRADPKHRPQKPPSVKQILQDVRTGYEMIAKYPQFKKLECVLTEIDPDGWAGGGAWDNANLNFRNTEYYPCFVAAAFAKVSKFARSEGWDLRLLSWAFMFVGERCFEGTRAFSTQGIDKPILNLFRAYAKIGGTQVALVSDGEQDPLAYADLWGSEAPPDVSGFAALTGNQSLEVLLYNHHDDWNTVGNHMVKLNVSNLPFSLDRITVKHYRIDQTHSNAYAEWLRQGKPMYPSANQVRVIKSRQGLELVAGSEIKTLNETSVEITIALPVHSVSLLVVST